MQKVIGTIGCPGSGKSTLSLTLNPLEWVTITLDDWRQALFPPHRRTYWDVRAKGKDKEAQALLHHVQQSAVVGALDLGWNVFLADTHIVKPDFQEELEIIEHFGIEIHWVVLSVPQGVLVKRNNMRDKVSMQVPESILIQRYNEMWAEDAWWRKEKNVTILNHDEDVIGKFKQVVESC